MCEAHDATTDVDADAAAAADAETSGGPSGVGHRLRKQGVTEAERYGQLALKRHLGALNRRPAAARPSRVEYALSSMGQLETASALLGVWPGDKAPRQPAPRHDLEGRSAAADGAGARGGVAVAAHDAPAFATGRSLLTIGGDNFTWPSRPTSCAQYGGAWRTTSVGAGREPRSATSARREFVADQRRHGAGAGAAWARRPSGQAAAPARGCAGHTT